MLFCCLLIFFSKLTFSKQSFRNMISANRLDTDLGPNYLQRSSADVTSGQRVKKYSKTCVKPV